MPVTAKLSKDFYDTFGEKLANELVDLLNLVDTLERGLKEQTRWMFVAWATLMIPIIGLWTR